MQITRRAVLKVGAGAAALAALPRPLLAKLGESGARDPVPSLADPRLKALAERAIDVARSAGATYADVRLTHSRQRTLNSQNVWDAEGLVVGVRALVQGYWGVANGSVWSPAEMARLGREAAGQAKTNALGKPREVELAPAPRVQDGHWVMPVEVDPFELHPYEVMDFLASLEIYARRTSGVSVTSNQCLLVQQDRAFASSEGSYCTQRTWRSSGSFAFTLEQGGKKAGTALDLLTPAGVGWELYTKQPLREAIRRGIEELREDMKLPLKPVDVGRYDAVADAWTVAQLLDRTIGRATELDRALGYEANATGTSFLNDPLTMLGSYQVGGPLLTVVANRSEPGGAATVKWDDEGVAPEEFALVEEGVLAEFQTTRESAAWLKDHYARTGQPLRSHGCAAAPSALEPALAHTPNLALQPGPEALDFDSLVSGLEQGIAVRSGSPELDFQGLSGLLTGRFYEVQKGKRVALLAGAGTLFRAPELWKGLTALGGAASVRRYGQEVSKGEPPQRSYHSVSVPPAAFKQLTLVDVRRKI
jgi:TldD protein